MYPTHPLFVHLPIGLLLTNALLTVLYQRWPYPAWEASAFFCLWFGWLGLLTAVASGTYDAARQLFGANPRNDALNWINVHAIVGFILLAVYWQAWQLRRRNAAILDDPIQWRGYVTRLAIGTALLALNGWIGGHMVYELSIGR